MKASNLKYSKFTSTKDSLDYEALKKKLKELNEFKHSSALEYLFLHKTEQSWERLIDRVIYTFDDKCEYQLKNKSWFQKEIPIQCKWEDQLNLIYRDQCSFQPYELKSSVTTESTNSCDLKKKTVEIANDLRKLRQEYRHNPNTNTLQLIQGLLAELHQLLLLSNKHSYKILQVIKFRLKVVNRQRVTVGKRRKSRSELKILSDFSGCESEDSLFTNITVNRLESFLKPWKHDRQLRACYSPSEYYYKITGSVNSR